MLQAQVSSNVMGLFVNFAALTIVDVVTLNIRRSLPLPRGSGFSRQCLKMLLQSSFAAFETICRNKPQSLSVCVADE